MRRSSVPEVDHLVDFIRTASRGVILRRGGKKTTSDDQAEDVDEELGLIAGNGRFPFLVLDAARAMGHDVTIIAIKEEASKELEEAAARVAEGGRALGLDRPARHLPRDPQGRHITQAVMAGQVKHIKIFGGFMPDLTAMSLMGRLKGMNTDALIGAVADLMRERGVELINSAAFLEPLLAARRAAERRAPSEAEREDLAFGYRMADAIAGLDIGQTIAVKHQAVVAVEAMEGTDETIARAGQLAGDGVDDHQGRQAEPGHALRRADRRPGDDPGDANRRRQGVIDRRRADADFRSRRVLRVRQ